MANFKRIAYSGNKGDLQDKFIDAVTMDVHQEKHHEGYQNKLNAALEGFEHSYESIDELLMHFDELPEEKQLAIRNNGGGLSNHNLFFQIISANPSQLEEGDLHSDLIETFGSIDAFKEEFNSAAATRFGSGWAWLVKSSEGELKVTSTPNQDSPLMDGHVPLIGLDVWEHAYYLHYQNRRPDYIEAFWNVLDWGKVSEMYNDISS